MKQPNTFVRHVIAAAILGTAAGYALQAPAATNSDDTNSSASVGAYIDDSAITTSVKTRLLDNKQIDSGGISVETVNGVVTLSGSVKSSAQKATAERIARRAKGVKSINNQLVVQAS